MSTPAVKPVHRFAWVRTLLIVLVCAAIVTAVVLIVVQQRREAAHEAACNEWQSALEQRDEENRGAVGKEMAAQFRRTTEQRGWIEMGGTVLFRPEDC